MSMPKSKGKKYTVDGQSYEVAIGVRDIVDGDDVRMRVTIAATFGHKSFCVVKGLVNRSYWHDYPYIDEMRQRSIAITPEVVCKIIRWAHRSGWNPAADKSTLELQLDNQALRDLIKRTD